MRTLNSDLEAVQTNRDRRAAWKLYVYDIVSTRGNAVPETINRIVQGGELDPVVGPLDITNSVNKIEFTERSSDFAQGTLQGNSLSVEIADKRANFDPVDGAEKKWLQPGNVLRLVEGDESLDESKWVITFTGKIVGRAGTTARDRNNNQTLQLAAEDRLASFLKINVTGQEFPQGTALADIMRDLLETDSGFAPAEFDLGNVGNSLTAHASTQMVDESPMISLAKLAFKDGFVPKFRGDGVLIFYGNFSSKGVNVIYNNTDLFKGFARPFSPLETPNEVSVVGLEAEMTKVSQPTQELASAGITLGFFGGDATIKVSWSDDDTQQAENVRFNAISSVTGALIPFGAESFEFDTDPDGGVRFGKIEVAGAFYAPLVVVLYAAEIAASFIPDGSSLGNTIPIGRLVEAIILILIATIQATIGRGDYQILGSPYEYVFREIRGTARVSELPFVDISPVTIENHLISTQLEADAVALRELKTIRKRGNAHTVIMRHDLRLESGDKFILPNERQYIVTEITRTISRNTEQVATLAVYETTTGVHP